MRRYGEEFYMCSYCGQPAHHIVVWACPHHDEIKETYACDECRGKYWSYQSELYWHCGIYIRQGLLCGAKLIYETGTV